MKRTQGDQSRDLRDHAPLARTTTGQSGMTWPVILRAQASDRQAMAMLYRRFLPVVYRFALARVGDVHTAEDITSETFFAVLERIGETRARDELTFAAWALGIARNQVAMHFRRLRTRPVTHLDTSEELSLRAEDTERDPLEVITARESWAEVVEALNHLTEEQRAVILYRCVLDYSADDVARLLGKQAGAIRALQFRALASLARYLKQVESAASSAERPTQSARVRRRPQEE
jgi:RNA polymerase sigma-70 factor, ECF subfamily